MTQAWQDGNQRYVRAALVWVRARLERLAGDRAATVSTADPASGIVQAKGQAAMGGALSKESAGRRASGEPAAKAAASKPSRAAEVDERIAQLKLAMDSIAGELEWPPALVQLGLRLGLSQFGQEVLLLCTAVELDTGLATLCAQAQGDPGRAQPTFALALALFDDPAWDALAPEQPLRHWRLLEIHQAPGQPLTVSPLRADERLVNYLLGLNYLDDRLQPLLTALPLPAPDAELPASQLAMVAGIVAQLRQLPSGQTPPVVQLLGSDPPSKQLVASHVAAALGYRVYRLPAALLPAGVEELETLSRLWRRESQLLPIAVYLDAIGSELDAPSSAQASPVNRLLARSGGLTFLDTREVWPGVAAGSLLIETAKPSPAEQAAAWRAELGALAGSSPALLAAQFQLGLDAISEIARHALAQPTATEPPLHDRLWGGCLDRTRPRMDALAQRITPRATWDDLVLPDSEASLLKQIAAQVGQRSTVYGSWGFGDKMSRGLGISALFAGESGTGKTMAAEVIAHQLRLNLYRIDLSAVVSKYIGETEKNLRRLFDAAEDGGAILFFDEADALFGKRSEVKDSHDRYANIEINYLLQRMEAYRGLAVLATNMKSALDPAFLRRLRFIVNFQFPSSIERRLIWQKVFPEKTPAIGLDWERLAKLNLTGANIHSIALNAAFSAAQAGCPVTMPLLLDAARAELRKVGKLINELEFRFQGAGSAVA